MRRESESSEERDQDQVQNGEDRKHPSHKVSNNEKKKKKNHRNGEQSCFPAVWDRLQLRLEHLSIHQLLAWRRKTLGGRSQTSLRARWAAERSPPRSSPARCFSPPSQKQTFASKPSSNGNDGAGVQPAGCCCSLCYLCNQVFRSSNSRQHRPAFC